MKLQLRKLKYVFFLILQYGNVPIVLITRRGSCAAMRKGLSK